jgi:cytochrome P450
MIDLLSPELHDRDRILDELRASAPIAWRQGRRGPGYWAVTGYPELVAIARDPATFTSYLGTRPEVRRTADSLRPLHNLDPPAHTELRRIAKGFAVPTTIDLGHHIERFTGGDAMALLAIPITSEIFAAWLGIAGAAALHAEVAAVHAAGAAFLDDPDRHREAAAAASTVLADRMRTAIGVGGSGVLGELHDLVANGALDLVTATVLATVLAEAGLPTTIDAFGNALATITERPADLARAIELSLELAPIQQFARYATRDVELGGAAFRTNQQLVLWYGAANRDPRRGDAPHLSFGAGPHRCLGATFARRILTAFFTAWFARHSSHRASGERRASSYMNGFVRLDVLTA